MDRIWSSSRHWMSLGVLAFVASVLVACGGGGGQSSCSGGQNVYTTIDLDTSVFRAPKVGDAISLQPQTPGVPASCLSERIFSLDSGSLPDGLTMSSSTGGISGTLTSPGHWVFVLKLELPGFAGSVSAGVEANVADPAAYTLSASHTSQSLRIDSFQLTTLGSSLVAPGAGFIDPSSRWITANVSSDSGINWSEVSAGTRPKRVRGFSVASDASHVYVVGGFDGDLNSYLSSVSSFDGANWSEVQSVSPLPGRSETLLLADATGLFAIGGTNASGSLSDVWFSSDGGVNWIQRTANFAGSSLGDRKVLCAGRTSGGLAVISRRPSDLPFTHGQVEVWKSSDGANWAPVSISAHSPLLAVNPDPAVQCVVANGRIYLFSTTSAIVQSSDLVNWNFERGALGGDFGGATVLNGVLYVAVGISTSTRWLLAYTLLH